ncbi:type II toxin-antitoxin system RelE/ParE family toxin [Oscillospiraceae bacterium 44-34]|jgi:toxin ParE1/3/4|uniref:type II toxin-antitoxin system RelE/ParE family toxin n=1 Tax=uncultured Oscillibacter sp. TaxID=876091 RepID=UPI0023C7DD19|nr:MULTISPECIES: type II toxin-antitoxin system RelE/ParE family toxin [Clostridia]MDE6993466.1 type II toxin-antitoxin system RelE/ParE family toxin [Lachnospiraceae bacterium]
MMKYRIEIGAQAQSDITDIMRYIGQVLLEPRTAGNLYRLLKEEILSLKQMPERYPYEDDDRLRALGIRKLLVKNYKVLYFVDTERQLVQVARVVYAGRDISRLLDETEFENV